MDVRCENCQTAYEFHEARVKDGGVTVKCTQCGHIFKVRRRPEKPRTLPGIAPAESLDDSLAPTRVHPTTLPSRAPSPAPPRRPPAPAPRESAAAGAAAVELPRVLEPVPQSPFGDDGSDHMLSPPRGTDGFEDSFEVPRRRVSASALVTVLTVLAL